MPADDRFVFRSYAAGDEASILDLFTRSFGAARSIDHWRWKYQNNPFGNERIGLAVDESRVVAQYAGYAVPFWLEGRALTAHHIADIMSDRAVRHVGRGPTSVFARAAQRFYADFCVDKIAFNYGFSTATSRAFGNRFLGVETVEPVTFRARDNVPRGSRLRRWLSGYRLQLVGDAGAEYNEFFQRVAPAYRFLVRRDASYVRWRYLQFHEPGYFVVAIRKRGRLVGWSAFRIRDETLIWGDALFDPADPAAVEVLLRHVAPAYPVSRIECWFPPRPVWFHEILQRLEFAVKPEPNDLSLGCAPFVLHDVVSVMRSSLYYAMGDSDLF